MGFLVGSNTKSRTARTLAKRTSKNSSMSTAGSVSTSKPKTTAAYSAPKSTYATPSTATRNLSGVNLAALSLNQQELLKKKGYTATQSTKQAQAPLQNVVPQVTPQVVPTKTSNAGVGVSSAFSNIFGLNTLGGKQTQPLQFSVLPGAQSGPVDLGYANTFFDNNRSDPTKASFDAARTVEQQKTIEEIGKSTARAGMVADLLTVPALAAIGGPVGPEDAANYARLSAKYGDKAKTLWSGIKSLGSKGAKYLDDLLRSTDNTASVVRSVEKAAVKSADDAARAVANTATRQVATRTMSNLGRVALGVGTAAAVYTGYQAAQNSGTLMVRNAVPSTGSTTNTTKTSTEPVQQTTTAETSQTTAPTKNTPTVAESTQQTTSPDVAQTGVATTTNPDPTDGARPEHLSSSSPGQRASGGIVGEDIYGNQAGVAGSTAMEFARATAPNAAVSVPSVGDTIDVGALQQMRDRARQLLDTYGSEAVSMPEFKSSVQAMLDAGIANVNRIQPTPPEPVVETPEQADWLSQVDPFQQQDMRAYMDEVRRNLGMPEIEAQRIDLMQKLQVVGETYQKVIDDIRKNPNLPKGLAARRLTEVFEDQKFSTNQLIAELDIIDERLNQANSALNREMGIFEYAQNQAEKAYQRRIDQFGLLVDTGAIGGLNDNEMQQWAAATGIPVDAIAQLKSSATNVKDDLGVRWENDEYGNTYQIIYDKNNPLAEPTVRNIGQLSRNYASNDTPSEFEGIYDEKNLPSSLKAELIDRVRLENASYEALKLTYPEVSEAVLRRIYDEYATEPMDESAGFLTSVFTGISNLWNKL